MWTGFGRPLLASRRPDVAWRAMLWIGVVPALLVFWIMARVQESPVWLARQAIRVYSRARELRPLAPVFRRTAGG